MGFQKAPAEYHPPNLDSTCVSRHPFSKFLYRARKCPDAKKFIQVIIPTIFQNNPAVFFLSEEP
jgi:hypothetical protein